MFVVFDLDGTLALIDHRRHLVERNDPDWGRFFAACDQDKPNEPIVEVFRLMMFEGHNCQIWSGRSDEVRDKTVAWLNEHVLRAEWGRCLKMRQSWDFTPDQDLKQRWLEELAEQGISIDLVFDDRDKVVAMWRANGIPCAQVAPGDF